jgi:hypothetical protein
MRCVNGAEADAAQPTRGTSTTLSLSARTPTWLDFAAENRNSPPTARPVAQSQESDPPLMTREEAREWLTDSRMGFGFSGPLADMPVTETMDPLADAGDIDRRTALGLLFDPELDDLRRPERIYERLERAFRAAEVRFGDRANALPTSLADRGGTTGHGCCRDRLLVSRTEALRVDVGARMADAPFDIALAALEAIERALRAHIRGARGRCARLLGG